VPLATWARVWHGHVAKRMGHALPKRLLFRACCRSARLPQLTLSMRTTGVVHDCDCLPRLFRLSTVAQGWRCTSGLVYFAAVQRSSLVGRGLLIRRDLGCGPLRTMLDHNESHNWWCVESGKAGLWSRGLCSCLLYSE
jgi:hypothetical protein